MICPICRSTDIDHSDASTSCRSCGLVIEESQIVSDVTFAENSAGGAVVQGSYVGNEQRGARTQGPGGFRSGGTGASREQTISNARFAIRSMGSAKRVPQSTIDKATRLFQLALEGGSYKADGTEPKNFVLGRKSEYTQASCLYVACRLDKTNHMLIDFADILSVNVFVLGRSYLRLVRCLALPLPVIDPSIYISRFASLLDFGDETQRVAMDATRLVQRFNKDWITHGRRPAGICGACLLIAARMNHFRRSIAEIVQVVKIADVTLRKRLDDFKNTPSGRLTIDDFRSIWLEEENEPPAFYLARMPKKAKRIKGEGKRKRSLKDGEDYDEEEDEWNGNEADEESEAEEPDLEQAGEPIDPRLEALAEQATAEEISRYLDDPAALTEANSTTTPSTTTKRAESAAGDDDFADLDDEELDAFILTEEEVRIKERVWIEFNRDFLEKTLERQLKMEADIKAGVGPKPPKRKRVKHRDNSAAPSTAAESATQMMQQKKFSKRLNYDVISKLFDNETVKAKKSSYSDDGSQSGRNNGRYGDYFRSDGEEDQEIIEEEDGNALPSNHPSVRRKSRLEQRQRARRDRLGGASSAGDESGTDRGTSRPLTDGETDTERNSWKVGLTNVLGGGNDEEDYGDQYGDDGEGIL